VSNSRSLRWAGTLARMAKREMDTGFCGGNVKERDHLGDLGVYGG